MCCCDSTAFTAVHSDYLHSCCRGSGLLGCRKCPPWSLQSSSVSALAPGRAGPALVSCSSTLTLTAFARRSVQLISCKQMLWLLAQPLGLQLGSLGSFWRMPAAKMAMFPVLLQSQACWHRPRHPQSTRALHPWMSHPHQC